MRKEHIEQVKFFNWLKLYEGRFPSLRFVFAIPNESYGGGKFAIIRGKYFKAEGRKRGVPDVFVPIAKKGYHGMFIEMKVKGGSLNEHQKEYLKFLADYGYYTVVCYSFEEAKNEIIKYLDLNIK